MRKIRYHSTNNTSEQVSFRIALMNGLASNYGLYMIAKDDIPKLNPEIISSMKGMSYSEIAFEVLYPFLWEEIALEDLKDILKSTYDEQIIPTKIQHVTGNTFIMWLTNGPTYSFKDYAARFFGKILDYFLKQSGLRRVVIVATSGDTGGAVADALHGLERICSIIFFPKRFVTEQQRRQMTTLQGNVYAFEVNGDFDTCQALAKRLLGDKRFANNLFNDPEHFTSANSISLGRLLPQAVYPFFAYSVIAKYDEPLIISIPSGNFGNMMGTLIAKTMGLPISKILCGVNENKEFSEFLLTGEYRIKETIQSPSSAMNVSNPSNFARLTDFYSGHVYDHRDDDGRIIKLGIVDITPDMKAMKKDLYSVSVSNIDHYAVIKKIYDEYHIIIEPHGAVGWQVLDTYLGGFHKPLAVICETADPGKFPDDIEKAIGLVPGTPERIAKQATMEERIFYIDDSPDTTTSGSMAVSDIQYEKAKNTIEYIFKKCVTTI